MYVRGLYLFNNLAVRWKRALNYPLVYGIHEAKALKFESCIILDFFCELPSELQKPWQDLVLDKAGSDFMITEARAPVYCSD